jgi:hypothetical protein
MLALQRRAARAGLQPTRPTPLWRASSLIRRSSSSGATPAELQRFLVESQGFSAESVARLLLVPEVTKCNIETRIAPLCHFLLELGCTPEQVELMVFK